MQKMTVDTGEMNIVTANARLTYAVGVKYSEVDEDEDGIGCRHSYL